MRCNGLATRHLSASARTHSDLSFAAPATHFSTSRLYALEDMSESAVCMSWIESPECNKIAMIAMHEDVSRPKL